MNLNTETLKKMGLVVAFVLIMGTLVGYKYYGQDVTTAVNKATNGTVEAFASAASDNELSIELPPAPSANAVAKGVVEIGASGFNTYIVQIDKQGNYAVKLKKFGNSLAYEGLTNTDEVKRGLKDYLALMLNKGVSPQNLHFVISSGALKEPKTKVIADGIRKSGFVVNEVSAEQEGIWALQAAMHPNYRDKSFVVDVGSGNTKISWYEGNAKRTIEASGAKYFQNTQLTDADVTEELRSKVAQVPADKRKICFVIGGVPNYLAKTHPNTGDDSTYIQLNNLDSYKVDDDAKNHSGVVILKAIQSVTGCTYIFNNNAFFPIGFLASLK